MTSFAFNFSDDLLFRLSYLYSDEDETVRFEADRPFLYFVWDGKTNTTVFSGCLKDFEGKKKKISHPAGQPSECFAVDGTNISCDDLL